MVSRSSAVIIRWKNCGCVLSSAGTNSDRESLLLQCARLLPGYSMLGSQTVSRRGNGQPFFPDCPELHLSISRCDGCIAAAASTSEVAVDIEAPGALDSAFVRAVSTDSEWEHFCCSPDPSEAFCGLWTKKEAALKCSGVGLLGTGQLKSALMDTRCEIRTWRVENVILSLARLP